MAQSRKRKTNSSGFISRVKSFPVKGKNRLIMWSKGVKPFIKRRPMASFLVALFLLFLAISANSFLTQAPRESEESRAPIAVDVYEIGVAPRVSVSAKADKEGVIQIVAQTPGIVSSVNVFEGQQVYKGTVLVSLASNYQGGNALSAQRQLASAQYQNARDTFDTQKGLIGNQREVALKTAENSEEMRQITEQSANETRVLIQSNAGIIQGLEAALQAAESGGTPEEIAQARGLLFQARSANAQLTSSLRNAELQISDDSPQLKLTELQRDIALKQLDLQEKALELSLETSRLQLVIAQINEATMYPATPFDGVVERVNVVAGQSVNPGTVLATIAGNKRVATLVATVPFDTASKISKLEESKVIIGGKEYGLIPDYISSEATDGLLNSVIFTLPDEAYDKVSDGEYVKVELPVGYPDTLGTIPYIPIDIVSQTQDGAFVFVIEEGRAKGRRVELGDVVGSYVAVNSGLSSGDRVILDRNIVTGEQVSAK